MSRKRWRVYHQARLQWKHRAKPPPLPRRWREHLRTNVPDVDYGKRRLARSAGKREESGESWGSCSRRLPDSKMALRLACFASGPRLARAPASRTARQRVLRRCVGGNPGRRSKISAGSRRRRRVAAQLRIEAWVSCTGTRTCYFTDEVQDGSSEMARTSTSRLREPNERRNERRPHSRRLLIHPSPERNPHTTSGQCNPRLQGAALSWKAP